MALKINEVVSRGGAGRNVRALSAERGAGQGQPARCDGLICLIVSAKALFQPRLFSEYHKKVGGQSDDSAIQTKAKRLKPTCLSKRHTKETEQHRVLDMRVGA
jgi:hypothetical protein